MQVKPGINKSQTLKFAFIIVFNDFELEKNLVIRRRSNFETSVRRVGNEELELDCKEDGKRVQPASKERQTVQGEVG